MRWHVSAITDESGSKEKIYSLKTKNGYAFIRHNDITDMTLLLVKDKYGKIKGGYAQRSQSLNKEKEIAEKILNR